ncbi:MAG: hypothetical protein IPM42_19405 [Saprospiraceae bacterium]|nr:hypothetical protein [Saprospiraceae bacterium]
MNRSIFKIQWLFILLMGFSLASCSKTDEISEAEVETFSEELVFRTQEATNAGRFGCYELVFPVTIAFPNGETKSVANYEEMRQAFNRWKRSNPRVRTHPVIAFPFEVINEAGDLILVENQIQQRELRIACRRAFFENNGPLGHNVRPKICFKPVFPMSVRIPDGTVILIDERADRRDLHEAIRNWRKNNPGSTERPTLVFPTNFRLEDGSIVTVNSREELKLLKESCN